MTKRSRAERPKSSSSLIEVDEEAYAAAPPEVRAALDAQLAALSEAIQKNPLNTYQPYEKQRQFHAAPERTRAFFGGNRTGKTTCAVADDLIQVLPEEMVPEHLLPYKKYGFDKPAKVRVITPDLTDTMEAVLEKFRAMTPSSVIRGGSWEKGFDKVKRNLWFKRGDRVNFMSTEQDANKFGGQAFHRIHFDEEPAGPQAWKIFRESRMRLIDYGGDMIFSMTPLLETDWVEDQIWGQRHTDRVFAVRASMLDNPFLSPEEITEALADLTDEERKAVEHGEFVAFGGKFYTEFSDSLHVREPWPPKEIKDLDVVVGIDPGSQTGVVWVGFDGDNRALVFDEFYPKDELVEDIAEEIKRRNKSWGITPAYVIDPAARIRSGPYQEQFATEYARHGIYVIEGQNQRGPGIMEVKRRLQKAKLFVSSDCRNLIWEFGRYRKDVNKEDEWAAIKKDDHLLDALRYAVMERTWTIPNRARPRKRSNFNPDPMFEPPWRGSHRTDNPPLGAFS